jgi:hypothetical protein
VGALAPARLQKFLAQQAAAAGKAMPGAAARGQAEKAPPLRTAGATFVLATTQAAAKTPPTTAGNNKKKGKKTHKAPAQAALSIWRAAGSVGMPPHSGHGPTQVSRRVC